MKNDTVMSLCPKLLFFPFIGYSFIGQENKLVVFEFDVCIAFQNNELLSMWEAYNIGLCLESRQFWQNSFKQQNGLIT